MANDHFECDCVPNLGPPHCHACSDEIGNPVMWSACPSSVQVLPSSTVDEDKLAAKLLELMREEAMTFENGSEEWIAESDPVEVLPALARGLSEWLAGGER